MKKVILGLFALLSFAACHNNDIETLTPQEIVTNNYNAAFVNAFGEPSSNQDWGFGSRVLPSSFGATTRGVNPNGNQWADYGYTVPSAISAAEREAVLERFATKGDAVYTSLVDWDCYFVQQVYKGEASYFNHSQYIDNDVSTGLKPNEKPNVVG